MNEWDSALTLVCITDLSGGGSGDGGWWVAALCEITGIELTHSGVSLKRSVAFEQHQLFSVWSLSETQGELKTAAGNTTPPYSVQH